MANSETLSVLHEKMDKTKTNNNPHRTAVAKVLTFLCSSHPSITFEFKPRLPLSYIDEKLEKLCEEKPLLFFKETACFIPTGGIIWAYFNEKEYPILVAEIKKQGTNDKRMEENKPHQAYGNAIDRIAKDIGVTKLLHVDLPYNSFVCFGHGCDFAEGGPMLDRIAMMNDFMPINKLYVKRENSVLLPVSMFFREKEWSEEEQFKIMLEVAESSLAFIQGLS